MAYGWGNDDVNNWNNPGQYDYGEAKKPYLDEVKKKAKAEGLDSRVYTTSKKGPDTALVDPCGKTYVTTSKNPAIVLVDGTASMADWPGEIFDRLPLLYQTGFKWKDDFEVAFGLIHDTTTGDDHSLQLAPFGRDLTLDKNLKALKPMRGGGPGFRESYELAAYLVHERVKAPNAESPTLIIMGDESFYPTIKPNLAHKVLGYSPQTEISSKEIFQELAKTWDIYLIKKSHREDEKIIPEWSNAIGSQKILSEVDKTRCVDQALYILATKWGVQDDFIKNIQARQDDHSVVEAVLNSLKAPSAILNNPDLLKSTLEGSNAASKKSAVFGK